MLLSAALLSLAVMLPAPDPQSPAPDTSLPYSVEGVRKAASRQPRAAGEPGPVERRASQYRLSVDTQRLSTDPCSQLVIVCQPRWTFGGAATWNDQFLAMTNAGPGLGFYSVPGNKDRLMAVGTGAAFALAFQGVANLAHKAIANRRENKVKKIRAEIAAELEALERANQAARRQESDATPRK